MKRLAALAATAVLVLTGCGDKLDGYVVSKEYEDGYWYPITTTNCNSQGVCTPSTQMHYHPECYRLWVEDSGGEIDDACVQKARYFSVEKGDRYIGKDV